MKERIARYVLIAALIGAAAGPAVVDSFSARVELSRARTVAGVESTRASKEFGVPLPLIMAVIEQESRFNPRARSPKGAMGLMQLMPATAREMGVADPYHPAQNVTGGVAYLAKLYERFDRRWDLALAAFNAGPQRVLDHGGIPPYRETQNYVASVMQRAGISISAP